MVAVETAGHHWRPARCSGPCSCVITPADTELGWPRAEGAAPARVWVGMGQIAVEPPPKPQHLEHICLGFGSLHPHQDSASFLTTAASPQWVRVFPALEMLMAPHPMTSKPKCQQLNGTASWYQKQWLPRSSSGCGKAHGTWGPGTLGVPYPCCPAIQGAADSGSHPAQHRPCHGMVFSCFSQSADACGNESTEGESKQG